MTNITVGDETGNAQIARIVLPSGEDATELTPEVLAAAGAGQIRIILGPKTSPGTDIARAEERLSTAMTELNYIRALPPEIGARIQWTSNGVVWRRVTGDSWVSEEGGTLAVSAHVASEPFEEIDA